MGELDGMGNIERYECPDCGAAEGDMHSHSCARSPRQRVRRPAQPEPRERYVRDAAEDREVTDLLTEYDRIVARLSALGVDVKARDRANSSSGGGQ